MSKYYKFDVNDKIKVKLTRRGQEHLISKGINYYKTDKNGYTTFRMWDFMRVFGCVTDLGFNSCFVSDILIKKENLKRYRL